MKTLLVFSHPDPASYCGSLCKALQETARLRGEVEFLDLYRSGFHPVLTPEEIRSHFSFDPLVQAYARLIALADVLVFVYPLWWGGPPALLKGFLDRVFRPGVVYDWVGEEETGRDPVGLLTDKRAAVFVTADQVHDPHSPLEIWRKHILPFCGLSKAVLKLIAPVRDSDWGQRKAWIAEAQAQLADLLGSG